MPGTEYDDLLELAVAVAVETAGMVRARRREGVEVAATKSSPVDIVTEVDRAAEELIFARLMGARLTLESEGLAKGATATLELPIVQPQVSVADA